MEEKLQPIVFDNPDKPKTNMKEILDQLSDNSDTESSDDSYYFHSLTNPLKTVSIKDLQINKLKEKIENQNKIIEEKDNQLETLNLKNNELQRINKIINDYINFLNIEFTMSGIDLKDNTKKSITNYKKLVLTKAIEFADISKQYHSLVQNYQFNIDTNNDYFLPLIHKKYETIKYIYQKDTNTTNQSNNYLIFLVIGILFTFILFFCN